MTFMMNKMHTIIVYLLIDCNPINIVSCQTNVLSIKFKIITNRSLS